MKPGDPGLVGLGNPPYVGPTCYICIGPYCWGRSLNSGDAIRRAKRMYPSGLSKTAVSRMPYNLYAVDEDAYVDDHGSIRSAHPVKKIRAVTFVGDQRVVQEKFDDPMP